MATELSQCQFYKNFINSEKNKASDLYWLLLNLESKLNLEIRDLSNLEVLLSNLSI